MSKPVIRLRSSGPGGDNGAVLSSMLLKATLVTAVVVVPATEAGSWFVTRVQLEDDAASAAVVAADAVDGSPLNAQAARTAFEVALEELSRRGGDEIDPASLRLFEDGTLRFTAHRTAPSLLAARLEWTNELMDVSAEVEASSTD